MSFVSSSGQSWKVYLPMVAELIGVAMIIFEVVRLKQGHDMRPAVFLTGMAIGIAAFVFPCLAVRCPNCGLRLYWYAVSKTGSDEWFKWVSSLTRCPECGCRPGRG
jgi:hypothetical protein